MDRPSVMHANAVATTTMQAMQTMLEYKQRYNRRQPRQCSLSVLHLAANAQGLDGPCCCHPIAYSHAASQRASSYNRMRSTSKQAPQTPGLCSPYLQTKHSAVLTLFTARSAVQAQPAHNKHVYGSGRARKLRACTQNNNTSAPFEHITLCAALCGASTYHNIRIQTAASADTRIITS
jgi:hypothetical protein